MSIELIKSQQRILTELSMYQGLIDGNWGFKSRSAMLGFQNTTAFAGLKARHQNTFFAPFEPLPRGWLWATDEEGKVIVVLGATAAPEVEPELAPPVITALSEEEAAREFEAAKLAADTALAEFERAEAARIESERIETERVEAERIETERVESERIETERVETERLSQLQKETTTTINIPAEG